MQNLFWIKQPCYINKKHYQGMMCVWIKGHLSAKSVKIVAIFYLYCNMYVVYLFLYFVYLVSADPDIGDIDGK